MRQNNPGYGRGVGIFFAWPLVRTRLYLAGIWFRRNWEASAEAAGSRSLLFGFLL